MAINQEMYNYANPYKLPTQGTWKPPAKEPNFLGSDFGALKGILKTQMQGDPHKANFRSLFNKQLGIQSNRAVKNINEQMASSGFRGAGANLIGDVFESGAVATQGFENDLLRNDTQIEQNAINQLLGLNQFEGNQQFGKFQSDRENDQFNKSQEQQWKMFREQLQFMKDSQPEAWEGILGSLLGAGAQVGSAALLASDERLKENIKKVGQKGDIDIVEFNYIGNTKRYRGVTAQQIEGNHPESVREINGIKFVDYSKIGLIMEAI